MAGRAMARKAKAAGISAPVLADFLGISRAHVAAVFAGKAEPSRSMSTALEALIAAKAGA